MDRCTRQSPPLPRQVFTWVGWLLFLLFCGVGLTALPKHLLQSRAGAGSERHFVC